MNSSHPQGWPQTAGGQLKRVNANEFIESGRFGGKGSEARRAAGVGETVEICSRTPLGRRWTSSSN